MTEIVKAGGSLAIQPDQTNWTPEQSAVLRQSGIKDSVTNAELASFLHLCQRTGLDPFSRQIYLIGRWNKKEGREVYTPQTGIDGYRVIAQRVNGQNGGTYGYEDVLWCDMNGQWRDVWLQQGAPAAAKVTVIRNGQRFSAVALFSEYVQTFNDGNPKGLWANMPAGQLAKCAEALALRKAFPQDLSGVYTDEEMAQADNGTPDRHLRTVQPGETDPWAAPEQGTPAIKGRSQAAQDIADAAAMKEDQAAVKALYKKAHAAGLLAETVKTADRELLELGAYLIARGYELAEAPTEDRVRYDGAQGDITDTDDVVDAEVMSPEDDYAAAVAELRAAAETARLDVDSFEADAAQALGMALAEAPVDAIRALAATIRTAA